jgi:pyruvate dehydrogenase E2 component (dihydrolipoamide acetyltransferase)
MQTVVMPKMGDTMEEGKILRWIKHEGDTVQKGDALAEIETDKVNIEAEAFAAGVLRKIIAQEGESIPIGQPIALIGKVDEPLPDETATAAKPAKAASKQAQANGTAATATSASARGPERTKRTERTERRAHLYQSAGAPHRRRAQSRHCAYRGHRPRRPHRA